MDGVKCKCDHCKAGERERRCQEINGLIRYCRDVLLHPGKSDHREVADFLLSILGNGIEKISIELNAIALSHVFTTLGVVLPKGSDRAIDIVTPIFQSHMLSGIEHFKSRAREEAQKLLISWKKDK